MSTTQLYACRDRKVREVRARAHRCARTIRLTDNQRHRHLQCKSSINNFLVKSSAIFSYKCKPNISITPKLLWSTEGGKNIYYHPRMRVGNVFGRVCLSVCLSVHLSVRLCVCVSVCLSVQTITFEPLNIGTSFLVWGYILTISRSTLSIKVIGSRSRSCAKNDYLLISTYYSFVWTYRPLIRSRSHIKVKVTHQGQGQTKVNIKLRSFLRRDTVTRVVCIWIKCVLVM